MSGMWDHEEAGVFVETLFAKHHGEIYAYLLRMLREPELAADLTQDAFIKAYKNYDTLEKPENARAWLYQIAHRVALDEIRRRKIIRFFPWTGESRGSAPSAEHLVMDAHLSGDMQRALARIPERQRAALLLAELHDLTGVELAAALGVSHVAARALLTRARESLRQALAAERAAEAEADADPAAPIPRSVTDEPHRTRASRRRRPRTRPRTSALAPLRRRAPRRAARAGRGRLARRAPRRLRRVPVRRRRLRSGPPGAPRDCATGTPEPPRDLWARTAAAIEREVSGTRRREPARDGVVATAATRARRPVRRRGHRRRHRRDRPVRRVQPGARRPRSSRARAPPAVAIATTRPRPDATPIAVGAGSVGWVGTSADGALAYNVATVDEVCPVERQPDCADGLDDDSRPRRHLDPAEVDLAVAGQRQAVVVGDGRHGRRRRVS